MLRELPVTLDISLIGNPRKLMLLPLNLGQLGGILWLANPLSRQAGIESALVPADWATSEWVDSWTIIVVWKPIPKKTLLEGKAKLPNTCSPSRVFWR